MKESLKNLLLIFSTLLLIFSFIYYATRPKPAREYQLSAYLENAFDDSGHNVLKLGMEQAALDYKVELSIASFDESLTMTEKEAQLQAEVKQGKEGFILEPSFVTTTLELPTSTAAIFVNYAAEASREVPTNAADHIQMGVELAEEMLKQNEKEQPVLILSMSELNAGARENKEGLIEVLENHQIAYDELMLTDNIEQAFIKKIEEKEYAAVICLEKESSEIIGRMKKSQAKVKDLQVYGFGFSNTLLNLVDQGMIQGLAVSNQFVVGYAAVSRMVEQLEGKKPHFPQIASLIVTKENLFDTDNQKLLFPLIQ